MNPHDFTRAVIEARYYFFKPYWTETLEEIKENMQ